MEKLEEAIADVVRSVYKVVYETQDCKDAQPIPEDDADSIKKLADFLDTLESHLHDELSLGVEMPSEFFKTVGDVIKYVVSNVAQGKKENHSNRQEE